MLCIRHQRGAIHREIRAAHAFCFGLMSMVSFTIAMLSDSPQSGCSLVEVSLTSTSENTPFLLTGNGDEDSVHSFREIRLHLPSGLLHWYAVIRTLLVSRDCLKIFCKSLSFFIVYQKGWDVFFGMQLKMLSKDQARFVRPLIILPIWRAAYIAHYNDVIMSAMASQITSLTIVYSNVYSKRRSNKTSKLRVTGLCEGNSPVIGEFPAQRASNAENVSIWWRHHDFPLDRTALPGCPSCIYLDWLAML